MYQIIAYNTNNPTMCTEIISDGYKVSVQSMHTIQKECGPGPYFGFDEKDNTTVFRFRGPYYGVKPFFIIDATGLEVDLDMKQTFKNVMGIIEKKRLEKKGENKR